MPADQEAEAIVLAARALLALVGLGAIAGLVMLFANLKTRPAGWVVSIVLLVLILFGTGVHFLYAVRRNVAQKAARENARDALTAEVGTPPRGSIPGHGATQAHASSPEIDESSSSPALESPPVAEEPRPWVGTPPGKVAGAYQVPITLQGYCTKEEFKDPLRKKLQEEFGRYVQEYLGPDAREQIRLPENMPTDFLLNDVPVPGELDFLEEFYWAKHEPEKRDPFTGEPMIDLHVLLLFDAEVNARLQEQWHEVRIARRLWLAGVGLVGVVGLLGVAFGYLRIDQATGGSYRGRLRLAAAGAILALAAAGWLVLG